MVTVGLAERLLIYATWYGFKKDLERRLGYNLLNHEWFQVKPKAPLPWDDSHMRAALSEAASLTTDKDYPQSTW